MAHFEKQNADNIDNRRVEAVHAATNRNSSIPWQSSKFVRSMMTTTLYLAKSIEHCTQIADKISR